MKNLFFNASGKKGRVRVTTLIVAGATGLITLGAGLTWTALADPGVDKTEPAIVQPTVDLDSLYAAKANEEHSRDTSFVDMIQPTGTIEGHISWYGAKFHGRRTANGERFDMNGMSAAHKTLPFNSIIRVEDQETGKSILVRINDRGPYAHNRVLDLSGGAAGRLGIKGRGTAEGRIQVFPENEGRGNVVTASDKEGETTVRFITFDAQRRGVRPNGWSVLIASYGSFDEAVDMQDQLLNEYDQVFLTRIVDGGKTSYLLSLGLFHSNLVGRDFLVELEGRFSGAEVIRFKGGLPVTDTRMTETAKRS